MKVCTQCHAYASDFDDYCPKCGSGNLVEAQQRPPQQRPPQQRPPQQRPPQQRPPQQGGYYEGQRPPQQRPPQQRPPQQGGYYDNQYGQRPPQQRPPQQGENPYGQRPPQQGTIINGKRAPQNDVDDFDIDLEMDNGSKPKRGKKPEPARVEAINVEHEEVTFGDWLKLYLKLLIPIYSLFVYFKTLIGGPSVPKSMTNCMRAQLVFSMIITLLSIAFYAVVLGSAIGAIM